MNKTELNKLSIQELRDLNKNVVAVLKEKQRIAGAMKSTELSVGDEVSINHKAHTNKVYVIEKMNPSKAIVKERGAGMFAAGYNVPYSMLTKLETVS